jgi:putative endonuclease
MERGGYVYIITNEYNTVLYLGVTSNLKNRLWEHKNKFYPRSFSARYNISKLVYFEFFTWINEAIAREKQLKGGSRQKKIDLINNLNPQWKDLSDEIKE